MVVPMQMNPATKISQKKSKIDDFEATFPNAFEYTRRPPPPVWDGQGCIQGRVVGLEEWSGKSFYVLKISAGERYPIDSEVFVPREVELRDLLEVAIDSARIGEVWLKRHAEGGYSLKLNPVPVPRR